MHATSPLAQLLCTAVLALAVLAEEVRAQSQAPEAPSGRATNVAVTAGKLMIATANPLASEAGNAVLVNGGTAVDAAIAAQLVLNLVEPQSSGLGGGAFLLHWHAATGTLATIDGRETAPLGATPDDFIGADGKPLPFWDAVIGGRSVGVPGTLRLLEAAHRRWGSRPWAELLESAARLAETGFAVSPRLAQAILSDQTRGLDRFAPTKGYFFNADGKPLAAGSLLRNPALAALLRQIATAGADTLYAGPVAADIVGTVRESPLMPGVMTLNDLKGYEAKARPPVCGRYRTYEVCGMGPPSSGGIAVLQILGILEQVDMAGLGPTAEGVHMLLEAMKLAFADRNLYVADPDFVTVPTAGLIDGFYLASRAKLLDAAKAMPTPASAGEPPMQRTHHLSPDLAVERPGTSHLVVVDQAGNAVSMTTTIEAGFGSRLMTNGFLLNNELTDFAFRPLVDGRPVANRVEPGKRPRSSMAPTIVLGPDRKPVLLVGSPGGARIIGYVAKTLIAYLDWGMELQEAIDFGNVINLNGGTELEAGTAVAAMQAALEAKGHSVKLVEQNSGVQAITIAPGKLTGAADPRREGMAAGE